MMSLGSTQRLPMSLSRRPSWCSQARITSRARNGGGGQSGVSGARAKAIDGAMTLSSGRLQRRLRLAPAEVALRARAPGTWRLHPRAAHKLSGAVPRFRCFSPAALARAPPSQTTWRRRLRLATPSPDLRGGFRGSQAVQPGADRRASARTASAAAKGSHFKAFQFCPFFKVSRIVCRGQ
jgi:hypothetical protein